MLSIANVSAAQAVNYYGLDNYYTKDLSIEKSMWWGKAAEDLGLYGRINSQDFEKLLAAKSPENTVLLEKKNIQKGHNSRAGIDLTFSAPKSVTLASLSDNRLIHAHQIAVNKALEVVQDEFSFVRRGKDRNVQKTGNLVVAQFHHDTSRKVLSDALPDPQIHTHCVLLNLTQARSNGGGKKWLTLLNDGFFNNSKLIGLTYQNELAKETQKLGYEIDVNPNGTFEIKGYTRAQIEAFSRRTNQINSLNAASKKEERKLKLLNRVAKGKNIERDVLLQSWWNRCEELGILHPRPKTGQEIEFISSQNAIDSATRHLAERDVSIPENQTISFALASHLGKVSSFKTLKETLSSQDHLILHGINRFGEKRYITHEAFMKEKRMISYLESGRGVFTPIASKEEIESTIAEKPFQQRFTKGQEEAFRLVSTTKDQVTGWQGVAGSGKSYALMDFRLLAEAKGHKVVGLAPDAEAVKVLGESTGITEARTVASFLLSKKSAETSILSKREIWIIDEAGKLNNAEAHDLLKQARINNAQVVLVGDTKQLSAVGAGNPFKLLQENRMSVAYLSEHRRQKKEQIKAAVEFFSQGKVMESLETLKDRIQEIPDQEKRLRALVKDYMALSTNEKQNSLILSGTNHERRILTQKLRKELKKTGELTNATKIEVYARKNITEEQSNHANSYEIGDIVIPSHDQKNLGVHKDVKYAVTAKKGVQISIKSMEEQELTINPTRIREKNIFSKETLEIAEGDKLKWTRNSKELNRNNGQDFRVISISKDREAIIAYASGRQECIDLKNPQFLDHSLVSTAYSSQGKKAESVFLMADKTIAKESMYVALSRSVSNINIYCENFNQTLGLANKTSAKKSAHETLNFKNQSKEEISMESFMKRLGSIKAELNNNDDIARKQSRKLRVGM